MREKRTDYPTAYYKHSHLTTQRLLSKLPSPARSLLRVGLLGSCADGFRIAPVARSFVLYAGRFRTKPRAMILRDPVHGLIAFEDTTDEIVEQLLGAREVQRLRRIRQLGLTSLAYPGAEHSRFSHAIGTAHVMKRLALRLVSISDELPAALRMTEAHIMESLAAALLHDIGHGPMSHMFEGVLPKSPPHETWTKTIILSEQSEVHQILSAYDTGLPQRVSDLVSGKHSLTYLARSVSGNFDVDRCDYLLRDAHATGVRYGNFDLDWFHRSLRFGPYRHDGKSPALAIDGAKGLAALESFVLARLFMFQQVYFHKATRAAEWMMHSILRLVVNHLADGGTLDCVPSAIRTAAHGRQPSLEEYLALDDSVLVQGLKCWASSSIPLLADLCQRILRRTLYKTIDLDGSTWASPYAQQHAVQIARDVTRSCGLDPDVCVGLDVAEDTPFDDKKDSLLVVFSSGKAARPAEVSFLLDKLNGQTLRRTRLMVAPEVRTKIVSALGL